MFVKIGITMSTAWAPGHATLFFAVPERFDEPSRMGSLGGGFNIAAGVTTTVGKADRDEVYWNGELISGEVSITCINLFREQMGIECKFRVEHQSELRIGYGLSTSGAGALGTLLAVNHLYNNQMDRLLIYDLAHQSELINHTGLGSVVAQISSGIELRTTQGGPSNSNTLVFYEDVVVFIIMFGPLKTSSIITSEEKMRLVTVAGIKSVDKAKLVENKYAENYIEIGREFTDECGLSTPTVKRVMSELGNIGENNAAMAMIGQTIVVIPQQVDLLRNFLVSKNYEYIETRITNLKPQVLSQ